jgi:hypothetical protein
MGDELRDLAANPRFISDNLQLLTAGANAARCPIAA